jgi:hypothetical protein
MLSQAIHFDEHQVGLRFFGVFQGELYIALHAGINIIFDLHDHHFCRLRFLRKRRKTEGYQEEDY